MTGVKYSHIPQWSARTLDQLAMAVQQITPKLSDKTTRSTYYLIASVVQECKSSLAGRVWFKVSCTFAVRMLARVAVIWRLNWTVLLVKVPVLYYESLSKGLIEFPQHIPEPKVEAMVPFMVYPHKSQSMLSVTLYLSYGPALSHCGWRLHKWVKTKM